ncbi:subclass B1 metallo-beta-lactamase [bacterium]|nr:subclass B1 metallo-beta-lactamase [bacterium]
MKRIRILILLLAAAVVWVGALSAQDNAVKLTDDLEVTKLSDNVYLHVSYKDLPQYGGRVPANGLVYVNQGRAFMIDTPWDDALTGRLIDWVQDSLHVKLDVVVPTHWHADCMGGLAEVQRRGIASFALDKTCAIARSKGLPVPQHEFSAELRKKFGSRMVICYYPGAGHTVDNIVVYLPAEKILFGGCLVKELKAKGLGNLEDAVVDAWPHSLNNVLKRFPGCRLVAPGHGACGDPGLIRHTLELTAQPR